MMRGRRAARRRSRTGRRARGNSSSSDRGRGCAMSRAEVCWPSAKKPFGLTKWLSRMPSRRASRFIMAAKVSTLPPTPSAMTIAMSLADFTSMHLQRVVERDLLAGLHADLRRRRRWRRATTTGIGVSSPIAPASHLASARHRPSSASSRTPGCHGIVASSASARGPNRPRRRRRAMAARPPPAGARCQQPRRWPARRRSDGIRKLPAAAPGRDPSVRSVRASFSIPLRAR